MARINVEDSIWSNPKFLRLCIKLGDEHKAIGMLVTAWRYAHKFWCPDKLPIPESEWSNIGMNDELIEVTLAYRTDGGIYLCGSEEHFSWWFEKVEAGRKGGIKSGQLRKDKIEAALKQNEADLKQCSSSAQAKASKSNPLTLTLPLSLTQTTKNKELKTKISKKQQTKDLLNSEMDLFVNSQLELLPISGVSAAGESGLPADGSAMPPVASAPTPSQNTGRFMGEYVKAFQKRYGDKTRPALTGKVVGEVKRFLQFTNIDRACDMINVYFQMDDKWFETKNHDFTTFASNLDKVGVALDTGLRTGGVDWKKVFGEDYTE